MCNALQLRTTLQISEFGLLRVPVSEEKTDFNAGFRVDLLRSSPKFRGAPWHDDVSTDIHDRGNPTYARVVLFFSALVAEEGDLRGDQRMGFALLKWFRQHGNVVQSHGMRQVRWETQGTGERPKFSVVPMQNIVKKELVMPGFAVVCLTRPPCSGSTSTPGSVGGASQNKIDVN